MIQFTSLDESHFPLLHRWLNAPHVQKFYSLRNWSQDEVARKYLPYLIHEKRVHGFIIFLKSKAIGYIQYYPVKDHPWPKQGFSREIAEQAAGLDLFIGEEQFCGRGYGVEIIEEFLKSYLWPHFRYCIVDPDVGNEASIRLFERVGFQVHKVIHTQAPVGRSVDLQLMILENLRI